jgi:hypothetical protein
MIRNIQLNAKPLVRRPESRPEKGLSRLLVSRNLGKDLPRLLASRMERRNPEKGLPRLVIGVKRPRNV